MKVIDDFLDKKIHKEIYNIVIDKDITKLEVDRRDTSPQGWIVELSKNEFITKHLVPNVLKLEEIKNLELYKMYINKFDSNNIPYWHQDGKGITALYYPNIEFVYDDLGETQFLDMENNTIVGVLPIPNRLVIFDGLIWHRATSFRDKNRYTIALKFG